MMVYAASQIIFDNIFRLEISVYSWIFVGFSSFHYYFGMHYLYAKFFSYKNNEAESNLKTYSESRTEFYAEYDRCNPITQALASKEYVRFLKSNLFCPLILEVNIWIR